MSTVPVRSYAHAGGPVPVPVWYITFFQSATGTYGTRTHVTAKPREQWCRCGVVQVQCTSRCVHYRSAEGKASDKLAREREHGCGIACGTYRYWNVCWCYIPVRTHCCDCVQGARCASRGQASRSCSRRWTPSWRASWWT